MNKSRPFIAALALSAAIPAFAQTATQQPTQPPAAAPSTLPATTPSPAAPPAAMPANPSASTATTGSISRDVVLTEAETQKWIDKVIYSSDGANLGEVAAFARDGSGRVTEMHGDLGGLMGIGETRVRIMPSQFRLEGDRVTLNLTKEQAKNLPQVTKTN